MGIFSRKEPEIVYLNKDYTDCCGTEPAYVPVDYDRKHYYLGLVRDGLNNLIAVDEVLAAARLALAEYDALFGPPVAEPEVPAEFYAHDDSAKTVA